MPKRPDISSVLVIGSGPIVIGQACEFDYSGTQACRVLREEGIRVILVNSNPATIMTDPEFADATYVEPITPEIVEAIIAKERPDAVLATLGGQTALNCAISLHEAGVLEKYGCPLIGANVEAIQLGEDREAFKGVVERCGAESARSMICHTMDELLSAAAELTYPVVVRPSFTMGGLGSGFAYDEADLRRIGGQGLQYSPTTEVLLEESILGWKEYELEVMRDHADNVVVVCSIENLDPMGVHTGDSITVAPALTLTDREYQRLRDIGIAVIREVGVETGGCNIQFAVNPVDGRIIVIEMNPRVSRSSALASKATGFPIAKIAAKMAIGYTLDEVPNDITRETPASFEPSLDYVVVKVPRFAFEKFPAADPTLTTTMKSVGEAMAIGRNFTEALQKALRSLEKKGASFHWDGDLTRVQAERLLEEARTPTDGRIVLVQQALRGGLSVEEVHGATGIDPWFLDQMRAHQRRRRDARGVGGADARPAPARQAARLQRRPGGVGPADAGGRRPRGPARPRGAPGLQDRRHVRRRVRRDDALPLQQLRRGDRGRAAGAPCRHHPRVGSEPDRAGRRVRLLLRPRVVRLARQGFRHRHDQLQPRDGLDRLRHEQPALLRAADPRGRPRGDPRRGRRPDRSRASSSSSAGQTPLGLAQALEDEGVPIVGTSPSAIHLAEDRGAFGQVLARAGLIAPKHGTALSADDALVIAREIGYPVLVRPSYVLGGRGMVIVYDDDALVTYVEKATEASPDHPILIDRFLDDAIEIDVDAVFDGEDMYLGGIMEHVEEAGIHSGDSSCTLPPATLGTASSTGSGSRPASSPRASACVA